MDDSNNSRANARAEKSLALGTRHESGYPGRKDEQDD